MSDQEQRRAARLAVTDPEWTRAMMARRERSAEPWDLTYLSFGAGVQSTALLAMCLSGEPGFPRPDVAIYADTQSELQDTDDHVRRMAAWCLERGVPLHVETAGSLEAAQLGLETSRSSGFVVSIPAFTDDGGMLRRQCTRHHKLEVILLAVRKLLGLEKGQRAAGEFRVRSLIGISYEESDRMADSGHSWITNTYPLVEARLARWDCEDAIRRLGLVVPPKSSCVFCPYHSDAHWLWMKRERPDAWARAVAVDEAIRGERVQALEARHREARGRPPEAVAAAYRPAYLHSRRLPLADVPFEEMEARDKAQLRLPFGQGGDGFREDCTGMCGV